MELDSRVRDRLRELTVRTLSHASSGVLNQSASAADGVAGESAACLDRGGGVAGGFVDDPVFGCLEHFVLDVSREVVVL